MTPDMKTTSDKITYIVMSWLLISAANDFLTSALIALDGY
jgi:hypothetical protein